MQDRIARHAEALGVLDAIVAHVTDDDLERATPCTGWSVADLLAHELGQHLGFAAAVREGDAPESSYTSVPFTHHAWRGSVQAILEAFAGADPDAPVVERELAPVSCPCGRWSTRSCSTWSPPPGTWPRGWATTTPHPK